MNPITSRRVFFLLTGCIAVLATGATARLGNTSYTAEWQDLGGDMRRVSTPSGWLVQSLATGGLTFVPDSRHEWNPTNAGVAIRRDIGKPVARTTSTHHVLSMTPILESRQQSKVMTVEVAIAKPDDGDVIACRVPVNALLHAFAVTKQMIQQPTVALPSHLHESEVSYQVLPRSLGEVCVSLSGHDKRPWFRIGKHVVPASEFLALERKIQQACERLERSPGPLRLPK